MFTAILVGIIVAAVGYMTIVTVIEPVRNGGYHLGEALVWALAFALFMGVVAGLAEVVVHAIRGGW